MANISVNSTKVDIESAFGDGFDSSKTYQVQNVGTNTIVFEEEEGDDLTIKKLPQNVSGLYKHLEGRTVKIYCENKSTLSMNYLAEEE